MRILITTTLLYLGCCSLELKPRFEWKQLDYSFLATDSDYRLSLKQNIPTALDVYKDKLFVAVPRWVEHAVPSTLNYVNLKDSSMSPKLMPYPSLEENSAEEQLTQNSSIKSAVSIRVDRCDRLWVLDSGKFGNPEFDTDIDDLSPAILVYNLKNNKEEIKYTLPKEQFNGKAYFSTIVVEDYNCSDTFAYIGDASNGNIIVYSLEQNRSWIKTNEHFKTSDKEVLNYEKSEVTIKILDMSISKPNSDGFGTLYFHPIASKYIFSISTRYMRNESIDISDRDSIYTRGFSSASFVDQKSGILFYSLLNPDGIACWNTANEFKNDTQGHVYGNSTTMVYPADMKVDSEDNLWILTNKMPEWKDRGLLSDEINFRIFSVPVSDAIKDTVCEDKITVSYLVKNTKDVRNAANLSSNSAGFSYLSCTMWMVYLLKLFM